MGRTPLCFLAITISSLLPGVLHAQDAGVPEVNPALVVRAAVRGSVARLSRTLRQRGAPRSDLVLPLRAARGECLEVVGYATGATRVSAEVVLRDVPVASEVVLTNSLAQAARGRFCAEVSAGYSLRVHAEGPAWWSLVVIPAAAAPPTAPVPPVVPSDPALVPVVNVARPPAAPTAAPSPPVGGVENDYVARQIRQTAQAQGITVALSDAARWTLDTNAFRELTAVVPSGMCVELVASGVPSVGDLVLELYDPAGNRVAQDATHQGTERARFCPPYAAPYRGRVRVFSGAGLVSGQLLQAPAGRQ